jgi:hypothetical protein
MVEDLHRVEEVVNLVRDMVVVHMGMGLLTVTG